MPNNQFRLAYLVSHPIQYQAPLLRLIAAQPDIDLTVYFQSDLSVQGYRDTGFGRDVRWDVPLLEGYHHEFLPALGRTDRVDSLRPWSYGIASRLRRRRFDVLWAHGYSRPFNWAAMIAARLAGVATLVRDDVTSIARRRSAAKIRLKQLFFAGYRGLVDGLLAVGSLNRDFYLENGFAADRIFLLPYAVDNEYFAAGARNAAPSRAALRAALGLADGRPVILFASKFQHRKRPDDLIAAVAALRASNGLAEAPYLLLVGDGEMRAELERQARPLGDVVRFLGFKNQSELPAFFDLCDVFVLPSEFEPWGLVVNEAMNAGRPIIVSDKVGCAPDLVRPGVNGHVFPVGDVGALAAVLATVLRDRAAAKEMGRASAEIIARWGFQEDLAGLRQALASVSKRHVA